MFAERDSKKLVSKSKKKHVGPQILDVRRNNNVSICLSRFKKVFSSYDEIIVAIIEADFSLLTEELLQSLVGILPSTNEEKRLLSYRGKLDRLSPAEIFMRSCCTIPRVGNKVNALLFCRQADGKIADIRNSLNILLVAFKKILTSSRLVEVLESIRRLGNVMNSGSKVEAIGFTMDSLLKLSLTRSVDKKCTVMDLLIKLMVKQEQWHLLSISKVFFFFT